MSNVHPLTRPAPPRLVRVGPWVFEAETCRLHRDDEEQRLTPKAAAVLAELLRQPGQVVSRETLFEQVWPRGEPSQDLLNHAIKELRRALGDDLKAPTFIETIPKAGYRLIAEVAPVEPAGPRGEIVGFPSRGAIAAPATRRPPWGLVGVLGLLLALVVGAVLLARRDRPTDAGAWSPRLDAVRFVTAEPGEEIWPRLAPDGGFVAYAAPVPWRETVKMRIFVRAVDGTRSVRITREVGAGSYHEFLPVWSPDAANLAFLRLDDDGRCQVLVVSALGGVERSVYGCREHLVDYFDWSPDGRVLAVTASRPEQPGGAGQIALVDMETGALRYLSYGPAADEHDLDPRFSPDGRWIAFRRGAAPFSDLYLMPAAGGEARRVTRLGALIRGHDWLPDGSGLVFSSNHGGSQSLWAVALDGSEPVALGQDGSHFPDVAHRRARLVFQRQSAQTALKAYPLLDSNLPARTIAPSTGVDHGGHYSPVDGSVAFVSDRSGQFGIWVWDAQTQTSRLVAPPMDGTLLRPRWSPDGSRITFTARSGRTSALYVIDVRSGKISRVTPEGISGRWGNFTPDSRAITASEEHGGRWIAVRRELDGSGAASLYAGTEGASDPVLLPDGSALYYTKHTGSGLFRYDLGSRTETRLTDRLAYRNMDSWQVRSDGVFFLDASGDGRMAVWRLPHDGGEPALVRAFPTFLRDQSMSIAPGGREVLVAELARDDSDLGLAELVLGPAAAR